MLQGLQKSGKKKTRPFSESCSKEDARVKRLFSLKYVCFLFFFSNACLSLGDLPNPEMEPASLTSPALAGEFFTISATCEARAWHIVLDKC